MQYTFRLLILALSVAASPALAAPTAPELTDDEEALLQAGELVVRMGIDDIPYKTMGVVEIDAPPAKVWEEILDFQARVDEIKSCKGYEIYGDKTAGSVRTISAFWEIKVVGTEIVYNLHYNYEAAGSYLWYTLDTDKESDLVVCDGSYQVIPSPINDGGSRFYYTIHTESARSLPESVKSWLAARSLKDFLGKIRGRSQD